jgi:23S rRNA (uracil1939-C5)-methyltransferase
VDKSINQKYTLVRKKIIGGAIPALRRRLVVWGDQPGEPRAEVFTGNGNPPDIVRIVRGKQITVPGAGFFQTNIFLVERLINLVVEMAALSGGETVIDLYGGAGLFSLFLGSGANHLFCIERDEEAVRCARINLNRQGLTEARCYQGDAAEVLNREFAVTRMKTDVIVLDPPREGCSREVIAAISSLQPKRIIYVSCNPSTLARDVRLLTGSGYDLQGIQPLDMFPQTSHIEAVALLTKGS